MISPPVPNQAPIETSHNFTVPPVHNNLYPPSDSGTITPSSFHQVTLNNSWSTTSNPLSNPIDSPPSAHPTPKNSHTFLDPEYGESSHDFTDPSPPQKGHKTDRCSDSMPSFPDKPHHKAYECPEGLQDTRVLLLNHDSLATSPNFPPLPSNQAYPALTSLHHFTVTGSRPLKTPSPLPFSTLAVDSPHWTPGHPRPSRPPYPA